MRAYQLLASRQLTLPPGGHEIIDAGSGMILLPPTTPTDSKIFLHWIDPTHSDRLIATLTLTQATEIRKITKIINGNPKDSATVQLLILPGKR